MTRVIKPLSKQVILKAEDHLLQKQVVEEVTKNKVVKLVFRQVLTVKTVHYLKVVTVVTELQVVEAQDFMVEVVVLVIVMHLDLMVLVVEDHHTMDTHRLPQVQLKKVPLKKVVEQAIHYM